MTTTLTRRHFLQLAAAAVAGTVAAALGAGRGVELPTAWDQTPTWMNDRPAHELLSSAHPDITLEIHKWRETDLGVDDDWAIARQEDKEIMQGGYLILPKYQAGLMEILERIR